MHNKQTFDLLHLNLLDKYDGEFIIPNDFNIREELKAGNYETVENMYKVILKGLKIAGIDVSDIPENFKDLGEIEDVTDGEGDNFKKFILVSSVLTTLYTFKVFIQSSSYKERIDSMDGMMNFVSEIEGSFEKLKEMLKAKEEKDAKSVN